MLETLSLKEREWLIKDPVLHLTGFTPRPVEKLATKKRPREMVDIECSHFLRCSAKQFTCQQPAVEFQLWLEAGKYDPPFPKRPDSNYNSSVWRNFRRSYGFSTSAEGRKISELIAAMYPLNIPPPSHVGEHTFDKYIKETRLIQDEKNRMKAIKQTKSDLDEIRQMKHRSDARNPPLDKKGSILPPENYKHYAHRFIPVEVQPDPSSPIEQKIDMFGRRYTPRSKPRLWKLSYKLNHPEFDHLREEVEKRRIMIEEQKKHGYLQALPSPVSSRE